MFEPCNDCRADLHKCLTCFIGMDCCDWSASYPLRQLMSAQENGREQLYVCHGQISLIQGVPRGLEAAEALSHAYCLPAEEAGGTYIVIKSVR